MSAAAGQATDGRRPRFVLATHNRHKLTELREILTPVVHGLAPQEIVAAGDVGAGEPRENATSFAGNALIKARHLEAVSGLPAIADDSGLTVEVLGGAPGIFSARWAGRHGDDRANYELLLAQLADMAPEHRRAAFVCAAALVLPDGEEIIEHGIMPGVLLAEPRGNGGFGYDPVVQPDGHNCSAAELSPAQKNAISHRGRALRALAPHIAKHLKG